MTKSRDSQFGELTVISTYTIPGGAWRKYANCICSCGNRKTVRYDCLQSGNNRSCGHLLKTAKGLSTSRTYRSWARMRTRCYNLKYPEFHYYGGRGIEVCERWRDSFLNFLEDMGECPSNKHSIDRIDVNGHYSPHNCRWATTIEQANNTRINIFYEVKGERLTLAQLGRKYGFDAHSAYARLKRGTTTVEELCA